MLLLGSQASLAQRLPESATRFTESDCRWMHKEFLGACVQSGTCGPYPDEDNYPMALQRNMFSLENVITVAAMHEIEAACMQSCRSKHPVDYSTLRRTVCAPLMKR
jgi:hypothetical protein